MNQTLIASCITKTADGVQICKDGFVWLMQFYTHNSVKIAYYPQAQSAYINPCISNDFLDAKDITVEENGTLIALCLTGTDGVALCVTLDTDSKRITMQKGTQTVQVLDYSFATHSNGTATLQSAKVVFGATQGEAFYGLGQQQSNLLDYAGSKIEVFHNYKAKGGETIGVPFLVSGNGYGIIMNTLAQTTVTPGVDGQTVWEIDCAQDISFIVMLPEQIKGVYAEYRTITGVTPMPLKSALGYIQCKQRYKSETELRDVVTKYREKHYPLDMVVVDWFYWKHLGDMKMDPEFWPTPKAMTSDFLAQDVDTMISVWPRFMKESLYYDTLEERGWFMKDLDGNTLYGTPDDRRGALIDTTNPECGAWYWSVIAENLGKAGFCAWWTDEDEPDLWPYAYELAAGKGYEVFNLYPYTHTKAIYEGHRATYAKRCNILSRAAYLGAQKFGTQFWSSDIYPTWDVLKKQIPCAINFSATGLGYWSSDIGAWQALPDYHKESTAETDALLLETKGENAGIVTSKNYDELYVRWFAFGAFSPIFRAHGTRDENEVWSYGAENEPALVKFLKLRYRLMPYLYAMAYQLHTTGTPILRGLFLESNDPKVKDIKDEYLFGDSLLVAPVVEQGARAREVYLPNDCAWYDFWTNERHEGGTTVLVQAPLDSIPLFVRENSILPMGKDVESTKDAQNDITLRLYGDGDATFTMYLDDGVSYDYETGAFEVIKIQKTGYEITTTQSESTANKLTFHVEIFG